MKLLILFHIFKLITLQPKNLRRKSTFGDFKFIKQLNDEFDEKKYL